MDMLIRFIFLCVFSTSFIAAADSNKALTIYHDADYSLNQLSAKAM
jgi:branched-chain amino acid transport system substrate-binding protein